MKKGPRKLKLHRETLQHLDGSRLDVVHGGFPVTAICNTYPECQSISYCYACRSVNSCPALCE